MIYARKRFYLNKSGYTGNFLNIVLKAWITRVNTVIVIYVLPKKTTVWLHSTKHATCFRQHDHPQVPIYTTESQVKCLKSLFQFATSHIFYNIQNIGVLHISCCVTFCCWTTTYCCIFPPSSIVRMFLRQLYAVWTCLRVYISIARIFIWVNAFSGNHNILGLSAINNEFTSCYSCY